MQLPSSWLNTTLWPSCETLPVQTPRFYLSFIQAHPDSYLPSPDFLAPPDTGQGQGLRQREVGGQEEVGQWSPQLSTASHSPFLSSSQEHHLSHSLSQGPVARDKTGDPLAGTCDLSTEKQGEKTPGIVGKVSPPPFPQVFLSSLKNKQTKKPPSSL